MHPIVVGRAIANRIATISYKMRDQIKQVVIPKGYRTPKDDGKIATFSDGTRYYMYHDGWRRIRP